MVYVLALGASLANALTSVLQRMGVEDAPQEDSMRLRLVVNAVKKGIWLAGFAFMIISFLLQATALHLGRLTEVQPVLTTELLFLVLILGTSFGFSVGWKEWLAATATATGLAGFLLAASPSGGNLLPSVGNWILVTGVSAGAIALCIALGSRGRRWWRASMYGTGAAVAYALTAAFTKTVSGYAARDWTAVVRHWETLGLIFFGVLAVFLTQNAYHAGPIAASQSTIVIIDPLASILIGVGLFGDNLRTSGVYGPLEAISLLVLCVGAFMLCRSPLVSGVKGDAPDADFLAIRRRERAVKVQLGES